MAEADRHQEEELEEERKRADSMTTARDNGINKFYKEYRWSGGRPFLQEPTAAATGRGAGAATEGEGEEGEGGGCEEKVRGSWVTCQGGGGGQGGGQEGQREEGQGEAGDAGAAESRERGAQVS